MQIFAQGKFCPDDIAISDDGHLLVQQYISKIEEDKFFHVNAVCVIEGLSERKPRLRLILTI